MVVLSYYANEEVANNKAYMNNIIHATMNLVTWQKDQLKIPFVMLQAHTKTHLAIHEQGT